MTQHPITSKPGETTDPVSPLELKPGDQIWHPTRHTIVTVTAAPYDSRTWRGSGKVDCTAIDWKGDGGESGTINHVHGDALLRRVKAGG